MQFRRQAPEAVQINMTPLIDVVFLLLIFFMVTTSFAERQLSLQLPPAETATVQRDPVSQLQVLTLYADGRLLLDEQELQDVAALENALQALLQDNPELDLVIRAEADASHRQVVAALDLARRLGIERVRIATRLAD
ncbi:ExbD/TolR family protein [Marinospirillum alkaliphilum]|uniref:Biopolymer transport protein ExbD n=1 Tax=Marinospirillum alkaliphilum DSM 21637 TaxID=1122209 RepID=A0A1K1U806_9GAMM|nr:biopolymer transporter ExbD [Marinospirillum alkaliphilum]SFX08509.1 biopolymer transport protein ExbD [Marinospirillum alkaliphilum DSM 21637]